MEKKMPNLLSSYHDVFCVCLRESPEEVKSACVEKGCGKYFNYQMIIIDALHRSDSVFCLYYVF